MKKVLSLSVIFLGFLCQSTLSSPLSPDRSCKIDSDCIITDISCSSCAYYAKWEATNKNYRHTCLNKKNKNEACPEAIRFLSAKPVCRSNSCTLMSPKELFYENSEYASKAKNHPLSKKVDLKCPEKMGEFYLSLPKNSNGIFKETFFFKDLITKEGMSSALKCFYRIKNHEQSYASVTVSFQLIGDKPIKTHFCARKEVRSPNHFIKVNQKFAITTSIKKFVGHQEGKYNIDALKKGFLEVEQTIQNKYAVRCAR